MLVLNKLKWQFMMLINDCYILLYQTKVYKLPKKKLMIVPFWFLLKI